MYEKVIDFTRKEVMRLIDEQGQNLFEQLLNVPDLLKSQQDGQQRNLNSEDIQQWREILKNEVHKVERFEVAFAVVGTMKAGKSTTINAIVGAEVLPNRNQPMTTLPTVIRHSPGKKEPELTFPYPEPFNELLKKLQVHLREKLGDDLTGEHIFGVTEEIKGLIRKILEGSFGEVRQMYTGHKEIYEFLKSINDIWRLAASDWLNISMDSYLEEYDDLYKFPIIEIEFFHLRGLSGQELQGNFALIDTPGPNEAGQTCLKRIMQEQLEKASAVLAVLDYTQLNAEADAEIRQSLEDIASVTDDRLFVLVNKFDQKDRNGMDAETLRSYVAKQLFEGRIAQEHVFPVSSKYGYLANRALHELALHGKMPDYRTCLWVEDFGKLALGAFWESELEDPEEIKSRAAKLWRSSMFEHPLQEVIKKGCENAAFMSLKSAITKMLEYDKKIMESLRIRQNALNTDLKTVENQIKSLEDDVLLIKDAQGDARKIIDESIKTLQKKIYVLFDESEASIKREIQTIFSNNKVDNWISRRIEAFTMPHKMKVNVDHRGYNDFTTAEEAQEFLKALIEAVANHVEPLFQDMQQMVQSTVDEMATTIWESVNDRLQAVLQAAAQRLNDMFSLVLDFPKPKVEDVVIDFGLLREGLVKEDTITKTETRYERKWYTLWSHKHQVNYLYEQQVYRIYTKDVANQSQELLEAESNAVWTALDKYIRIEFGKSINNYFADITNYLERFRGDLIDSKQDQKLEEERLANLQAAMSEILAAALIHRKNVQIFVEDDQKQG